MNNNYKEVFFIKNGKRRRIITYNNELQRLRHRKIKEFLEESLYFSLFTKAYRKNSSIYLNAKAHMYNDIFFKYDIKNFFESIDHKILVRLLHQELNRKKKDQYSLLDVALLVDECVIDRKGLPLGLITSPILSNIYLKEFDNIFYGKLKHKGFNNVIYTRYADDLTISFKGEYSEEQLYSLNLEFIKELSNLLMKYKLSLNKKKISIVNLNVSNHVKVTGINIVKKSDNNYRTLSVGKKRIAKLFDETLTIYMKLSNDNYTFNEEDKYKIQKIKGLNSFILSVHKKGYNHMLSKAMQEKILEFGYHSLSELISNLSLE